MNEKGRQTKLLAAIAVLAMVVCAFAVVMPSDDVSADAIDGESQGTYAATISGAETVPDSFTEDGSYLITGDVEITAPTVSGVKFYIVPGVSLEISGATSAESFTVNAASAEGRILGTNDTTVTVPALTITTDSLTFSTVYGQYVGGTDVYTESSSIYITGTYTGSAITVALGTGNDVDGFVAVPSDGTLEAINAITDLTYGIYDGATYYGAGASLTGENGLTLTDGKTISVMDGSVDITQGTGDSATIINVKNVQSSAAYTFTYSDGRPTFAGGAEDSTGTITIATGSVLLNSPVQGGVVITGFANQSGNIIFSDIMSTGAVTQSGDSYIVNEGCIVVIYGNFTGDFVIDIDNDAAVSSTQFIALRSNSSLTGSISIYDSDDTNASPVAQIDGTLVSSQGAGVSINAQTVSNGGTPETFTSSIVIGGSETSPIDDVVVYENIGISLLSTQAFVLTADQSVEFTGNGKLTYTDGTINILGDVQGTATNNQIVATNVYASDAAYVQQYVPTTIEVTTQQVEANNSNFVQMVQQGEKNIRLTLTADLDLSNMALSLDGVNLTIVNNSYDIVVNNGTSLTFSDSTVRLEETNPASATNSQILVKSGASLEVLESNLFIEVIVDENASVRSVGNTAVADNITGDINVGFGAEQTLSGTVTQGLSVYVWGTLIVPENSTLTINAGGELVTKSGADIVVNGTMNIAGTATIVASASMEVGEAGAVNVNGSNGNSQLVNAGKVVVDGAITVSAANTGRPANIIDAGTDFTVNGTMSVYGTLKGQVDDKGTITFSGVSDGAQITLFAGNSITVTSVTSTLIITDSGIMMEQYGNADQSAYRQGVNVSDGNIIELNNVRGVTVTESVTDLVRNSQRYVTCNMYVSGNATSTQTVTESSTGYTAISIMGAPKAVSIYKGQVYVDSAMTLGQCIQMSIAQTQTVNVTENGSIAATAQQAAIRNAGTMNVDGAVTLSDRSAVTTLTGTVNAVMYRVTNNTDGSFVTTYTNFADAMAAIGTADQTTATVLGTVTVSADASIAAGQIVSVQGTLKIDEGVTLTAQAGGKVSSGSTSSRIDVDGTFTAQTFVADVTVRDIVADVLIDNDPARTYTNLANAIALGETEITIISEVSITESLTIPEGVTVNSDYPIHVRENVVLTVEGTLNVSSRGSLDNATSASYDEEEDVLGEMTVSGTVADVTSEAPATGSILYQVDGAHYVKVLGATETYYITGLDIAAQNVDNTIENMTITVYGTVSADDAITFAKPTNADKLVVSIADVDGTDERTVVTVGTLTLDGATLQVASGVSFTGAVSAAAADGTATVDLSRAAGVTLVSAEVEDAEGTTDYLLISGQIDGTVTIASGNVTISSFNNGALSSGTLTAKVATGITTSVLNVASGATLSIPSTGTLEAGMTGSTTNNTDAPAVTVDGTVDVVRGTVNVSYGFVLNGTMNVSQSNTSTNGLKINSGVFEVLGTLNVSDERNNEGTVTVSGVLAIGSKPSSLGAAGEVNGTVTLSNDGYVKVYDGTVADVVMNGQAVDSTAFHINSVLYMTVYADSTTVTLGSVMNADNIQLAGLETPIGAANFDFWTDEALTNEVPFGTSVGTYPAVYTEFEPANVPGVVTVGAGINLYIDGVQVSGYASEVGSNFNLPVGTHRVSYEIRAGWDGSSVVFTFNGQTIQNNSTITVTADMTEFTLSATGATNSTGVSDGGSTSSDDGMGLTDYLLIVLVILIVVMAIMVALRLMRS